MRIRFAIPDRHLDESVLNAALETSTRANQRLLAAGEAPSIREAIQGGLRWRPERFSDGEHFDLSSLAAQRGWGDCDDLAPWLAAELRLRGDPGARAVVRRSGPSRWHALVQTGQGELVDPSRWAGMKSRRDLRGTSIQSPMARPGEGAAAVLPLARGWAARTDLPVEGAHVCGMSWGMTPEEALLLSARGAALAGEENGMDPGEVAGVGDLLGALCGDVQEEETVGFLDSLLSAAGGVAKSVLPIASAAAPFIPGIGPIAAAALPVAGSLLSSLTKGGGGGGGAPGGGAPGELPAFALPPSRPGGDPMRGIALPGGGHVAYNPSCPGPVIVRF